MYVSDVLCVSLYTCRQSLGCVNVCSTGQVLLCVLPQAPIRNSSDVICVEQAEVHSLGWPYNV